MKTTTTSSGSQTPLEPMHGYGESWFENLNHLGEEYTQQKTAHTTTTSKTPTATATASVTSSQQSQAQPRPAQAAPGMHGYGDSWFEELNHQHEALERRKSADVEREAHHMHSYGTLWFENLDQQRQALERRKLEDAERQSHQMHNYGTSWFEKFEPLWEDWQHGHGKTGGSA